MHAAVNAIENRFETRPALDRSAPAAKPLVSFALFTFNQEKYVRKAIEAAFAQTYSPLHIEISDDCSRDGTWEIIVEMCRSYTGPHRVRCHRNPVNLGLAEHINVMNTRVEGEIVVAAAGDDISLPYRTQRIVDAWRHHGGQACYVFSRVYGMSEDGQVGGSYQCPGAGNADSPRKAALSPYPLAIGAAQAWSRRMIDAFPPLRRGVWAEDQIFGVRGLLLGPVASIDEPLVYYRSGAGGLSSHNAKFSLRRYVRNQVNGIGIYHQRAIDARHVGRHGLAALIAAKMALLWLLFPVSPVLSLLRRRQRNNRR